ncbi:hypothetical protein SAMN05192555_107252 [Franzmannia pantelleriensis]|uniref:DUF1285 domain-containing protein n=1 Tax=Franzmannia pantelleriensis TaxID=48727 RepID=A0A1G9NTM8_9GAMM|nr:DUF1285 domain-containing protein [Halomonas pantelleriensis]SDL89711.1 hypothetical protein SAMN05192555_107252 [Halomonas pantelleriensis]
MSFEPLLSATEPTGSIPPLERWHPALSGRMDLTIRADGHWVHEGTLIRRASLVRLLSTLLRREADGEHYLVTPVEKWQIVVEDCAFVVVDAEHDADVWWLTTNVGDRLVLGEEQRLSVTAMPDGTWVPEVAVRFGLAARLGRNVFYRLVEQAESRVVDGREQLGLLSAGRWQPLGELEAP